MVLEAGLQETHMFSVCSWDERPQIVPAAAWLVCSGLKPLGTQQHLGLRWDCGSERGASYVRQGRQGRPAQRGQMGIQGVRRVRTGPSFLRRLPRERRVQEAVILEAGSRSPLSRLADSRLRTKRRMRARMPPSQDQERCYLGERDVYHTRRSPSSLKRRS